MNADTQQTGKAGFVRRIVIDLSVLTVIGVVLGILAPLGTGSMSLASRIAYWVVLSLAGYVLYKPIATIVVGMRERLDLPSWLLWSVSVLIATVPMAVLVWIVNHGGRPVSVPSLEVALSHYFAVGVVGAVVTVMLNLIPAAAAPAREQSDASPHQTGNNHPPVPDASLEPVPKPEPEPSTPPESAASKSPAPNPLLDQLPPALGSDVIALQMEDHYVRVHTALGSELVLMRLRDAMTHVAHVDGRQVHRSWWVARLAVDDVKREGRNIRLVLDGQIEAPVARAQVAELKDAGWI